MNKLDKIKNEIVRTGFTTKEFFKGMPKEVEFSFYVQMADTAFGKSVLDRYDKAVKEHPEWFDINGLVINPNLPQLVNK